VSEAELHFARLLDEVERGETIIGTRHGQAIARIVPEARVPQQEIDQAIVGIALAERLGKAPVLRRLKPLAARRPRRHSKARDAEWVRYHCDVSSDFYRL
jgi:antitoxin (DNA-binding transcriptional repressor) of toxin-antitoxin stability system